MARKRSNSVLPLIDPKRVDRKPPRITDERSTDRSLREYLKFLTGELEAKITPGRTWLDSTVALTIGKSGASGHGRILTGLPASSVATTLALHYTVYKTFRSLECGQLSVWYSTEHGGRFMAATERGTLGAVELTFNRTSAGFPYILWIAQAIVAQKAAEELFESGKRGKKKAATVPSVRDP